MKTYQLYTYDVWGNRSDGFQVNDLYRQCTVDLPDDPTDKQIRRALYDSGVFSRGIMNAALDIHGESEFTLYVNHTARSVGGLKPLCELRCIQNTEVEK